MLAASNIPPLSHENTLGPYRLLRVLGEGGMGTVYLALDEALGRQLAVKVLRAAEDGAAGGAGERGRAAAAKRFMREAQSAAKLNHPHVVTIYAVGQQGGRGGRPYIAMEYVEGGSLAQRLRERGPLHWREAARAMRDALRGLAAAHQAGIVHRDVKPANLMCGRDGAGETMVKLTDFGLARQALGDGELTFPGAFVGSPSYSAPEQVAGAARIDGRADLYSLAATGYALVTGEPPFVAEDAEEVMERHLREAFPDVRVLSPTVPGEFAAVLARASRKKPEERYGSAREMLAAVEELLALPGDVAVGAVVRRAAAAGEFRPSSAAGGAGGAEATVAELETRLARARKLEDSSTQLETLRTLYGLYVQLDRREEARRAFREALVVHVKMRMPSDN